MIRVRRIRVAMREDGEVLAILGLEADSRASGRVILQREGMTPKAWRDAIWIRTRAVRPVRARREK